MVRVSIYVVGASDYALYSQTQSSPRGLGFNHSLRSSKYGIVPKPPVFLTYFLPEWECTMPRWWRYVKRENGGGGAGTEVEGGGDIDHRVHTD